MLSLSCVRRIFHNIQVNFINLKKKRVTYECNFPFCFPGHLAPLGGMVGCGGVQLQGVPHLWWPVMTHFPPPAWRSFWIHSWVRSCSTALFSEFWKQEMICCWPKIQSQLLGGEPAFPTRQQWETFWVVIQLRWLEGGMRTRLCVRGRNAQAGQGPQGLVFIALRTSARGIMKALKSRINSFSVALR